MSCFPCLSRDKPQPPSPPPIPIPIPTTQPTTRPIRSKKPISLTYTVPGAAPTTKTFDFLVIACDPRALPFSTRSSLESSVAAALTSYTFRTTLYQATRPSIPQLSAGTRSSIRQNAPNYTVRFRPSAMASPDGLVYGFRDEVKARAPDLPSTTQYPTYTTVYQLQRTALLGRDERMVANELDRLRERELKDRRNLWLDFKPDESRRPQPEEQVLVDYFPHFQQKELRDALPWKVRDAQGENATMYVSSFACFESVLHCFLYEEMLMRPESAFVRNKFPRNKNARIAVIGAGPSGLLFASQHLAKKGYNNFVMFEKQARFGGKTYTFRRKAPANKAVQVPCELGTCYLSPAYEPMYSLFEEYDAGEVVALERGEDNFRSVVDGEVAKSEEERENGVEFGEWTLRKNGPFELWERLEMLVAGVRYIVVHYATMGMTMNDCMPEEPPTELSVLENLQRLVGKALGLSNDSNSVPEGSVRARDMYAVLRDEKRDRDESSMAPRGLFDMVDDFMDDMLQVPNVIPVEELKKACRDVFNTSFAQFLDDNKMDELKSVFVYGYQVQGYGQISEIPAYYGLIWMTPSVLTGEIRKIFRPSPEAFKRGSVNVVSRGWGTLWEQIVEKDLQGKIVFNASITRIDRVMTSN